MQGRHGPLFVAANTRRLRPITATGSFWQQALLPQTKSAGSFPGGDARERSKGCPEAGRHYVPFRPAWQGGSGALESHPGTASYLAETAYVLVRNLMPQPSALVSASAISLPSTSAFTASSR